MRLFDFACSALASAMILAVPAAMPAKAQGFEYPYCTSGGWATDNICRFHTFEQCMTFVQGVGGSCVANPRAVRYPRAVPGSSPPRR